MLATLLPYGDKIIDKLDDFINEEIVDVIIQIVDVLLLALVAYISFFIAKRILLTSITRLVKKTATHWDDLLVKNKFFHKLAHLAPAILIHYLIQYIFPSVTETVVLDSGESTTITKLHKAVEFIRAGTYLYIIIMLLMVVAALLDTMHHIYQETDYGKNKPIKGYVQVVKIFVYYYV